MNAYFERKPEHDDTKLGLDAYLDLKTGGIVYVPTGENPLDCIFND